MEEQIQQPASAENFSKMGEENIHSYDRLGGKTLFMLVFNKSLLAFFLFVLLAVALVFFPRIPARYIPIVIKFIFLYLGFFLLVVAGTFGAGWLEYIHYSIIIDEKNLKIKKGFIAEETTGIPYRRITDVKIERSLVNQIFGVSDIIISTMGEEEQQSASQEESETFLPAIEEKIALHIQDLILKKAQVEQIDVLSGHDNIISKTRQ